MMEWSCSSVTFWSDFGIWLNISVIPLCRCSINPIFVGTPTWKRSSIHVSAGIGAPFLARDGYLLSSIGSNSSKLIWWCYWLYSTRSSLLSAHCFQSSSISSALKLLRPSSNDRLWTQPAVHSQNCSANCSLSSGSRCLIRRLVQLIRIERMTSQCSWTPACIILVQT